MTTRRFLPFRRGSLRDFSNRFSAGFSLVEVVIAIGIVAFAFVGLMGLLPVGLANFRGSVDTTTCAQIFQKIAGDAEQADFDRLVGTATAGNSQFYVLPIRYFDEQGVEVTVKSPGHPTGFEAQQIIYQARVRGSLPGPNAVSTDPTDDFTSLPAVTTGLRFSPRDSTILTIQIVHQPGAVALPTNDDLLWVVPPKRISALSITTYSAVITRNGFSHESVSNP